MMTPSEFQDWLQRLTALYEEMEANDSDPTALMVATVLLTLRGHMAALGEGDPRGLRKLFEFTGAQALGYIQEHAAIQRRVS